MFDGPKTQLQNLCVWFRVRESRFKLLYFFGFAPANYSCPIESPERVARMNVDPPEQKYAETLTRESISFRLGELELPG